MADAPNQSTPNIGANGFIWILLVAAGTLFVAHRLPLEGTRPPATGGVIGQPAGVQDVDARLWQDPFAAVAQAVQSSPEFKPQHCRQSTIEHRIKNHCRSPLHDSVRDQSLPEPLLVMVAPVSGAPYSEEREARRRTRYAILAGLNTEGFIPDDPQHIGFYWPGAAASSEVTHDAQAPAARPEIPLPKVVPFEWFRRSHEGLPYNSVLLLWFDEDTLQDSPIKQFDTFFCQSLAPGASIRWAKATILGPSFSTTLQSMTKESRKPGFDRLCLEAARSDFYVNSATTDDQTLIPDDASRDTSCRKSDTCLQESFPKSVNLYRMIATDEALARALKAELRLRHVNPNESHIALVSEWDTLYGRALPNTIGRCFGDPGKACQQTDIDADPLAKKPWLHPYKYLRGLDGQAPDGDAHGGTNGSRDSVNKQDKVDKDSAKISTGTKPEERAEGQGQYDYLRRLGDRIQQRDAELRQNNSRGIEAVGILGSDVYDKLLVLQALRPLLPNALFFTTDLDAIVLNPSALTYTRNLLVASSFGLQLRPELQGEIPPFRSSYQTAAFLSTRAAVRDKKAAPASWLQPRLFEVGSAHLVQFASPNSDQDKQVGRSPPPEDNDCKQALDCKEIHAVATPAFRFVSAPLAVALSVLALGVAYYPFRRRVWGEIDSFMKPAKGYRELALLGLMIIIVLAAGIFLLAVAIYGCWPWLADWMTRDGQPLILLDGISIWPTIFLRALLLILCVCLIFRGYRILNENIEKIFQDLNLVETRQHVEAEQNKIVGKTPPWIRFVSHFWYRLPSDREVVESGRLPDAVFRFWRMYIYQGYPRARLYRASAGVVAIGLVWYFLNYTFDIPPLPARGEMSQAAYIVVTGVLVTATWFLIFSVADTTLLTWRVVKAFRTETGVWPEKTLRQYSDRLGLPADIVDDWIDLVFVSKRTKCITTFIYYPFLIIALLVVSRSRLFANYGVNFPDIITLAIGILIVSGCAVALRFSAEALRAKARRRLNDRITEARKSVDREPLAGQMQSLLHRIAELRDGAFSPFSQQPVVRAMLLPLGSFGGTALLEYFLVPGFS